MQSSFISQRDLFLSSCLVGDSNMFLGSISPTVAKSSRCYNGMDSELLLNYSSPARIAERSLVEIEHMHGNSSFANPSPTRAEKILDELDDLWDELASETESSASDASLMSAVEKILKINDSGSTFTDDSSDDASEMSMIDITKSGDTGERPRQGSWNRLSAAMKQSRLTQEMLQEHDRKQGLPRSHCVTMMHTNRSRRQLEEGRILPKWNGEPLISKKEKDGKLKKQTTARAA